MTGFLTQGRGDGEEWVTRHDLSSLRIMASTGELWNPEPYRWLFQVAGKGRLPIINYTGGTEISGGILSCFPIAPIKPCSFAGPIPGMAADVYDEDGRPGREQVGELVITRPWPGMTAGFWKDEARYLETYWSRWPGLYFAGDGAKLDDDGDIWLLGRVDDVMNVSGHRLSTTEIESALVSHPKVAEAAVVGAADETTGQAVCAFVILRDSAGDGGEDIVEELRKHVAKEIGAIAKPRQIMIVPELPKTRSGKIMRRLLKDVAEHREVGDVTTLADSTVMDLISKNLGGGSSED